MNGLFGKKIGMTQVFTSDGRRLSVTVLKVGPVTVVQKKTNVGEGYEALQVGFEEYPFHKLDRAQKGHFQKQGTKSFKYLREIRMPSTEGVGIGAELNLAHYKPGDFVNVTGVSKGKGFQGVIKRHHKSGGPKSHGSTFHRSTGSIGQRTYPGKVFKNMKLPGHMGDKKTTIKNLEVVDVKFDENLLYLKGAVPGGKNAFLAIKNTSKDFADRK